MKRIASLLLIAGGTVTAIASAGPTAGGAAPPPKRPVAPDVDTSAMVAIAASSFSMGQSSASPAPYGDPWFLDQRPVHPVSLSGYRIDRREVTVAEFALFLTYAGGEAHFDPDQPVERVTRGYLPVRGTENQPIRQVTWTAADHYCRWAGKRLPTEAEWERAAAGVEKRIYPWGADAPSCERAAFFTGASFCEDGPTDVELRPRGKTPDGIADMAGGVAEWTADWYGAYGAEAQADPTGPTEGTLKAVRGGGFLDGAVFLRAQARWGAAPTLRSDQIGFRCVLGDADPASPPVRRGAVTAPDDVGRAPTTRPRVPAAPGPATLARGLVGAGAIVELGGRWYVAHGTEVVIVERGGGVVGRALDGLGVATDVATDGQALFVTDAVKGDVWRVVPGAVPTRVATGETKPGLLAATAGQVAWSTETAIRTVAAPATSVVDLASGLDGVSSLAFAGEQLVFAESGTATATKARLAAVPRAGGEATTLVPSSTLGNKRPAGLTIDPAAGRVYFMLSGRSWPYPTTACSATLAGADFKVHSFSPPNAGKVVQSNGTLYWSSLRAIVSASASGSSAFELPGKWARSEGLFAGPSGVAWTDQQSGRIFLQQP